MRISLKTLLCLMLGLMNSKMDRFTSANGRMETDMEEESNTGMTEAFMKDTGETVRRGVR